MAGCVNVLPEPLCPALYRDVDGDRHTDRDRDQVRGRNKDRDRACRLLEGFA